MIANAKTVVVEVYCPSCRRKVNVRTVRTAVGRGPFDPHEPVMTVKCTKCPQLVILTAADLHLVA